MIFDKININYFDTGDGPGIYAADRCLFVFVRRPAAMNYTYIVRCADDTLYTGWTNDLENRIKAHNEGRGAKYTRCRRPVALFYYEEFQSKTEAMSREYAIKRMTRRQKLALAGEGASVPAKDASVSAKDASVSAKDAGVPTQGAGERGQCVSEGCRCAGERGPCAGVERSSTK